MSTHLPPGRRGHRCCWLAAGCLVLGASALHAQTSSANSTANRPATSNTSTNTANRSTSPASSSSSSGATTTTRTYPNNTQLGDALIQIDPETRSLIIVADDNTQQDIGKVINNLDRPKPQVLIKVLFAQVTLDDSTNFGVEGSYAFNVGEPPLTQLLSSTTNATTGTTTSSPTVTTTKTRNTTQANGTTQTVTTTSQPYPVATTGTAGPSTNFGLASQTTGAFFNVNTKFATATLYALASKGKVTVLSRPSILARNNQQAVMVVGQEIPFITNSQITDVGNTINTIQYRDIGIILRVTPFITSNHTVEMIVAPEISSLSDQTVAISSTANTPIINKTAAETVVVTPDATTVVIGGMMQKQDTSTVDKVPLLGDIPFLGNAFKHTVKSTTKTELLIFLTPYIVPGTDNLEALSKDDVGRSDLPETALTPPDVNEYLDGQMQLFPTPSPSPTANPKVRRARAVTK